MTKFIFRFSVSLIILLILIFSSPTASKAQIRIPGIDKKPKTYSKTPDRNEIQSPINGEYKANPTFFSARTDDERCQAIDLWLSSIRYEASQTSYNLRYQRNSNEIDMERIDTRQVQRYATTFFRNIFGKSLPEMSEKEMDKVAKSLNKCTNQFWVLGNLENPFRYPVQMRDWIVNFDEFEQTIKQEKLESQKQASRERYQNEVREKGFNVAELLKETELYSLYTAFLNEGYTDWCSTEERQAVVGLIFNIDDVSPIESDDEYWQSFESEMLPVIRASCSGAEKIYILNYVDGFYINYDRNQVSSEVNPSYPSDVVNIGVFSANQNGKSRYGWINGDKMSNLIDAPSRRTQKAVTFKSAGNRFDNSNLATISGLRRFLSARQAKLDEEERIRTENATKAEAARRAEITRKAEARRTKLSASGFTLKGLKNEDIFANIFLGDFEALPFQRDDISFSVLISAYLKSYSEYCSSSLPKNKVEITRQECATERVTRNGWGVEISRTCVEWQTVGTGLYADPALYSAKLTVERAQAAKILSPKSGGGIWEGLAEALTDYASGKTLNEMSNAIDVSYDVAPLVKMNACTSPGLKRFQENMRRFAINERPLTDSMPSSQKGTSSAKTDSKPTTDASKAKTTGKKPAVNTRRKN